MTQSITDADFLREFGSYIRQVRYGLTPQGDRPGTCEVCGAPVSSGSTYCRGCNQARSIVRAGGGSLPLDDLAILTYAVEGYFTALTTGDASSLPTKNQREGRQAYRVLRGYKTDRPDRGEWTAIVDWTIWFFQRWGPSTLYAEEPHPKWKWATVPSRRSGRQGEHPLHRIVSAVVGNTYSEVVLTQVKTQALRDFDPEAYSANSSVRGAHVVLVEDSWASGGSVLSAAAALKSAGATRVSAMVLGRILNPTWGPSNDFIKYGGLNTTFNPSRSPWVQITA